MGLRRGAAAWCCVGAQQRGAVQGRSSVGLRTGAAAWGCADELCGAAEWWGGCVGAQRHGGALGRSVWLYRGAVRVCAEGRSVGLRRGAAAWGCAEVKQRGAA